MRKTKSNSPLDQLINVANALSEASDMSEAGADAVDQLLTAENIRDNLVRLARQDESTRTPAAVHEPNRDDSMEDFYKMLKSGKYDNFKRVVSEEESQPSVEDKASRKTRLPDAVGSETADSSAKIAYPETKRLAAEIRLDVTDVDRLKK